jgi:hypothetical protein
MNKELKLLYNQIQALPEFQRKQLAALIIADTLNPISMHDTAQLIHDRAFEVKDEQDAIEDLLD